MTDEVRIRQILINLIGNAVKFTDKGGISIVGRSEETDNGINIVLEVKDSGMGIEEKYFESIFEPFVQREGQNIKKYGGTGLGLSICKKLVEIMGGEISVESNYGSGSIFRIKLNNVKIDNDYEAEAKEEEKTGEKVIFETGKILIAEDNVLNIEVLKGFLNEYNFEITVVKNGIEAVREALEREYDLIFMDIHMPKMSGYEAIKRIRELENRKNKIVVTTATAFGEELNKLDKLTDGFISKPYNGEKMLETLKNHFLYKISQNKESRTENEIIAENKPLNKKSAAELWEKWKKISKLMINSDIESFALLVIKKGEEEENLRVERYGRELYEASLSFEIEKMYSIFNKFYELIEKKEGC